MKLHVIHQTSVYNQLQLKCGSTEFPDVYSKSIQNATADLNVICNRNCGDTILTAAREAGKCSESNTTEPMYTMYMEGYCLKYDSKFCAIDMMEKMTNKKGNFSSSDILNPANTELCGPCLKYGLEFTWTYYEKMLPTQNFTSQEIDLVKAMMFSLYNTCSNTSLYANLDKITFYNGSHPGGSLIAANNNTAGNSSNTTNSTGSGSSANTTNDKAAGAVTISAMSSIMNAFIIAGLLLTL